MEKNFQICLLLDFYGETLTDKQRQLTEMYYNEDMSLFEISEIVGITRQGVRDSIKRAEQIMTELEKKIGFCEKFIHYKKGLSSISEICRVIIERNKGYNYSKAIDEGIKRISAITDELAGQEGI